MEHGDTKQPSQQANAGIMITFQVVIVEIIEISSRGQPHHHFLLLCSDVVHHEGQRQSKVFN
jgi:hypothetical protein